MGRPYPALGLELRTGWFLAHKSTLEPLCVDRAAGGEAADDGGAAFVARGKGGKGGGSRGGAQALQSELSRSPIKVRM